MRNTTILLTMSFLTALAFPGLAAEKHLKILTQSFVLSGEQPFDQVHASTITQTASGDLLVAWFAGEAEGKSDVAIWLSTGKNGDWLAPVRVAKISDEPHWNPVLFTEKNGDILLFFKIGPTPEKWTTWLQKSTDNGKTWGKAQIIEKDSPLARGPVRAKPVQLSNGALLAGNSDEKDGHWNVFADVSFNHGTSWYASSFISTENVRITDRGAIQPTVWESEPGHVHMLTRSTEDVIFRSDSKDYGASWSPLYLSPLPSNNSGIDIVKLPGGELVLTLNNLPTDGVRTPMNAAVSFDNGSSWPEIVTLDDTPESEFSYPATIHSGNLIFGTYTWNRKNIAFWTAEFTEE